MPCFKKTSVKRGSRYDRCEKPCASFSENCTESGSKGPPPLVGRETGSPREPVQKRLLHGNASACDSTNAARALWVRCVYTLNPIVGAGWLFPSRTRRGMFPCEGAGFNLIVRWVFSLLWKRFSVVNASTNRSAWILIGKKCLVQSK